MTLDRLLLTTAGALVLLVGACIATARILRDILETWEGTTS